MTFGNPNDKEDTLTHRDHPHPGQDRTYLVIEVGPVLADLLAKLTAALTSVGATPAEQDALADTIDQSAQKLQAATEGAPKP